MKFNVFHYPAFRIRANHFCSIISDMIIVFGMIYSFQTNSCLDIVDLMYASE